MDQKTEIRPRIISSISNSGLLIILALVLLVALMSIIIARQFASPDRLIMTTGFERGAYTILGERYEQILAREKVQLKLLPSSGSIENLKRLKDKTSRVDAGFVQDGTSSLSEAENLVSLGAIGYAPLWVFYRGQETFSYLSELRGKRVAIGPEGSGVRKFAIDLLKLSNSAAPPTMLLDLSSAASNKALLEGTIDAVMIFGTEDNALVKELLYAPNVKLMNFMQAEAYTRLIPALSHVVLPQGILDFSKKMPPHDVHLLAATTSLIVRKDLHPALVYLLLDAAVEIHSNAGWVNKKGEFPSLKEVSFPSSNYAERFYKSGRPLLLDYLPFGIAAFLDRTILIIVPAAIILIPLIRSIPWLYSWRHRRKFYRLYRELKNLELELMESPAPDDIAGYHEKINRIEVSINRITVPLAFFNEIYGLQDHVDLVRGKLIRLSKQSKEHNS
ncbi:MAG: C4-dicarboxylate ABC transporter substrate-binding protein [Deltaproteobacteria bacterium]|nr:C4-dicarboxylate ABC transporter substrate-binding protein [Deltaproteobacteria bacterium]